MSTFLLIFFRDDDNSLTTDLAGKQVFRPSIFMMV